MRRAKNHAVSIGDRWRGVHGHSKIATEAPRHGEGSARSGHARVCWNRLCRTATYRLRPASGCSGQVRGPPRPSHRHVPRRNRQESDHAAIVENAACPHLRPDAAVQPRSGFDAEAIHSLPPTACLTARSLKHARHVWTLGICPEADAHGAGPARLPWTAS